MILARGAMAVAAVVLIGANVGAAEGTDLYAPRPADQVRQDLLKWLTRHNVTNEKTVSNILQLWAPSNTPVPPRQVFERLIQSFGLADPTIRQFVNACQPGASFRALPKPFLTQDESDEFLTAHLRLFYARALTQALLYDEALAVFARIDPAKVVDPATCLFYRAVCEHQLLRKKEGLATLDKLLHKTEGVAEPYTQVATLMQDELSSLDDQSLSGVSRKMQDSERRLDLGRGGQRVQKVQDEIIESLDEIIKKKQQQLNQQQSQSQQQPENNSNRSNRPADDSMLKGATAPGNVDPNKKKKPGTWGGLPPKAVTEAENRLNREFPSNYRRAVEEYFKKLATKPAGKEK
ncbi:MAG TPA: hypothetical protein VGP76_17350 [Planctomycetaceae bacterium]|nr:hypothetical protein [Planctomycetaceae bacterium]